METDSNEKDPKKAEMDFLHEDDLMPILETLGIKDAFSKGDIKCAICGNILTTENLGSLYQDNDEIKMVCNKEECLNKTIQS